ncbi:MAG: hypothetical protein VR71_08835 [Roseovarius sp. BRH_c41]|uniref:DUF1223 domain-containing protein n=1 Tax=Roseovarius sp. BRH_c41 TaxID=1629709 RepID=UPI0005F2425A|nr:DUF1223 domain-containing protein [Roseovarius sp. BRH_c41]KJS43766.1 MAG: hypothetical protein VR71_08835 [Roseovarius sp. BRH_c41]
MRQMAASVVAGLLCLWAAQGGAQERPDPDRPVVVELFTSQGCASCPPADAFFLELVAREDVVALSLHVDYWDYIGWTDSFGSPDNSARQRGYAKTAERKMVYTPQMIINGEDHVVGTRLKDVSDLIEKHRAQATNGIDVEVTRDEKRVQIRATADPARAMPLMVQLVRYIPKETVAIERGENAGQTITYANIVTEMTPLTVWDSREPLELDVELAREDNAVVLLQYLDHGTIEAVAHLR